jgi:hypothetical protein
MIVDGERSFVDTLLQSNDESSDLERLRFLSFDWLGLPQAQVPELVSDEVELAKDDPHAQPHPLWFIIEVKDDSHLKHKNKSEYERPLPGAPTVRLFCSGNIQQHNCIDEIRW